MKLDDLRLHELLDLELVRQLALALLVVLTGLLATRIANRRLRASTLDPQVSLILRRALTGTLLGLSAAWALSVLGVDMGVLLGAAGVLTVAVGFASQTSVSNLISGLFLMIERPFKVGDVIQIAGTEGAVMAIDLLSIKLRTFDNLMVRIPNESVLKANVTNLTHFAIRRYDLLIGVSYREDLARVRKILLEVAEANPLCLKEPGPLILFKGFADSAVTLQFSVWSQQEKFLELRNGIGEGVKRAFDAHGVELPFPHHTVHVGADTRPLPVQLLGDGPT